MRGADLGEAIVGVCVVRAECRRGERRLTVTATPDIARAAELPQHPANTAEVLEMVAGFLSQQCPPEECATARSHDGTAAPDVT